MREVDPFKNKSAEKNTLLVSLQMNEREKKHVKNYNGKWIFDPNTFIIQEESTVQTLKIC